MSMIMVPVFEGNHSPTDVATTWPSTTAQAAPPSGTRATAPARGVKTASSWMPGARLTAARGRVPSRPAPTPASGPAAPRAFNPLVP